MKAAYSDGDETGVRKAGRRKYSSVIPVTSNKNRPPRLFQRAHVNTTCLPAPFRTHSFDNTAPLLPPFFLLSSSSSCRCLTAPSLQPTKRGRLSDCFFSSSALSPSFSGSLSDVLLSVISALLSLSPFSSSRQC